MSAKPPLLPSRRGLSPRGRDTPASLRAGRAGARPGGGRSVTHATALRAAAPSATFRRHSRSVPQATALRAAAPSATFRRHSRSVPQATALRAAAPSATFRRHSRSVPQATALRAACRIGGGWRLLTGSSPAVCAVCVAYVLACGAAARCAPLYPSASATLPLRSRLARAPREHTAVRGRTRGVDGGAGCPTERGKVTSDERHGFSMGAAWVLHGCCMGGMVGFADEMGWD